MDNKKLTPFQIILLAVVVIIAVNLLFPLLRFVVRLAIIVVIGFVVYVLLERRKKS